ncbi:hypothetical protein GG804_08260 [Sphingomonas histidinilytica]|uniref:2OG-Fe dioxygenase family protein n=1 Tax=Rhizorhabdus histidinilytica TaxID=439228 RepID=A0A1T5AKJ0_9SPHN|nr:2OG-Fe dioxygenase family protein [Rhizorhabdus histidinilytica]MBO9376757.1 hypothetical protein [Rhizorhabdus histidinilytica]SKB35123.1 hypothetical protein SAMN06295920_10230 [Rhizorhabdus histidinilytica]
MQPQTDAPPAFDPTSLRRDGFAIIEAAEMRALLLEAAVADFAGFARSWERLGDDRFMADGGRYRRRRHAVFAVGREVVRKPHQPHYQSRDYNMLNGGIERWFEPVEPDIAAGPALQGVIGFADRVFTGLSARPETGWHVEVHQFRIEAAADMAGLPTPEGLHRDGVDWVLVMLVARHNVEEGVTKIHGPDRREIGSFCLAEPFDAVLIDDHRIYHAVTPIVPIDSGRPAYRDVLVVTFRAA